MSDLFNQLYKAAFPATNLSVAVFYNLSTCVALLDSSAPIPALVIMNDLNPLISGQFYAVDGEELLVLSPDLRFMFTEDTTQRLPGKGEVPVIWENR